MVTVDRGPWGSWPSSLTEHTAQGAAPTSQRAAGFCKHRTDQTCLVGYS